MDTALFEYPLPDGLIAQTPADRRDGSRLMLVNRKCGTFEHAAFTDLPDLLAPHTRIFRNNASVFKARLHGRRRGGGAVECLLLRPSESPYCFWCLLKPGRKLPPGSAFEVGEGITLTVRSKNDQGQCLISVAQPGKMSMLEVAERHGEIPLPPYIRRNGGDGDARLREFDRERYQTIYADPVRKVAAAAPTAGLHFSPEVIQGLQERHASFYDLTLHIGLDTFRPIQSEQVENHTIHREMYEIPAASARAAICPDLQTRLAVGTTSMRALEDYARKQTGVSHPSSGSTFVGEADIFIYPPANFQCVDALLTNFHLPRSTLLCLVSAFLCPGGTDGIAWLKELYAEAVHQKYRFFSYGDAMLIL